MASRGFPYFPGIARGTLYRGGHQPRERDIALITQDDITRLRTRPAGLLLVDAAPFSHTMITLLGWGLPTILITREQAAQLPSDTSLEIDGSSGIIRAGTFTEHVPLPPGPASVPARLADGEPVHLLASLRSPQAAARAVTLGAEAIGLVRSEFLLPEDDRVPDNAFYRHSLGEICAAAAPLTVTLRLLDIAADKRPAWLPHHALLGQPLGLQGVRLYHEPPVDAVVNAQLDAVTTLHQNFSLRVLIPYLVRLEELRYWRDRIRPQLPAGIPLGAMAETPASVLDIQHWLEAVDFIGIGCNDLMQSLFAADRDQPALRDYLDPYAPVLFRLFREIAERAGDQLERVQLCGVLPQIRGVLPVLLGLGYRHFSIDPPFIPYLARSAAGLTLDDCHQLAAQVCAARTTQEVLEILDLTFLPHSPFAH